MKKTQFKVTLFEGANKTAELVALEAAKYNGRSEELNINLLYAFGETVRALSKDEFTTLSVVSETALHIDVRVNNKWILAGIIEEIEVFELTETEN